MRFPKIYDVRSDLIAIKSTLTEPGEWTEITLGASEDGSYGIQTGDNSFSGSAYNHPHWGVGELNRRTNCAELARNLIDQIKELTW